MATCGHCKRPGQTVAHVRTCGQADSAVATAERTTPKLPELNPGNVVTLTLEDGYWLVEANLAGDEFQAAKVQARGRTCASFHVRQVEMVFPNLNSAAEYRIADGALTAREQISEALHGDPNYCRGCAKGWRGAKWHRDGCPVIEARYTADVQAREAAQERQAYEGKMARDDAANESPWAPVQRLREQIKPHLNRETKRGKVRHFALGEDEAAKFYRVKELPNGRVYVDAVAGGSAHDHDGVTYPVKNPGTLVEVLTAILVDPDYAAKRYGQLLTRCSDCNRTLTDSTSRALGIGPECRSK